MRAGAGGTYFLHIPKTGGTTLRWILEGHVPARACAYLYLPAGGPWEVPPYQALQAEGVHGVRCFSSHAPLGTFPDFEQALDVVTLLREPVARTISHHHHARQRWPGPDAISPDQLVRWFLETGRDNLQVRLLSGIGSRGRVDDRSLERAKRALRERVGAFGVVERFEEALVLLARRFGWEKVVYVRRNTTRPSFQPPDPALRRAITELNVADVALYDFACRLLRDRLAESPVMQSELARIREAHALERLRVFGQRVTRRLLRTRVPYRVDPRGED